MFQAPETPRSSKSSRFSRKDPDQTISLDPAIQERGPIQNFDDTFFEESDDY